MDQKELIECLGPPKEQHLRFEGESHYLFFHGWKLGYGEYVAEGKSEQLSIYMTTVGEFVVTYNCVSGEEPDEELEDHVVQFAASHQDLDEALSELAIQGDVNPLAVEIMTKRARRDWPLPEGVSPTEE
jgi:hypothetical protein